MAHPNPTLPRLPQLPTVMWTSHRSVFQRFISPFRSHETRVVDSKSSTAGGLWISTGSRIAKRRPPRAPKMYAGWMCRPLVTKAKAEPTAPGHPETCTSELLGVVGHHRRAEDQAVVDTIHLVHLEDRRVAIGHIHAVRHAPAARARRVHGHEVAGSEVASRRSPSTAGSA